MNALHALLVFSAVLVGQAFAYDCVNKNKTHNYYFGYRFNDELVFMANPKHDSSWLRTFSEEVVYPISGERPQGNITYVEVLDQYHDGSGGCAFLTNGGVGQDHVSFHVKSKRGGPYNFIVRVYAKTKRWRL